MSGTTRAELGATFRRFLRTLNDEDLATTLRAYDDLLSDPARDKFLRTDCARRRALIVEEMERRRR